MIQSIYIPTAAKKYNQNWSYDFNSEEFRIYSWECLDEKVKWIRLKHLDSSLATLLYPQRLKTNIQCP